MGTRSEKRSLGRVSSSQLTLFHRPPFFCRPATIWMLSTWLESKFRLYTIEIIYILSIFDIVDWHWHCISDGKSSRSSSVSRNSSSEDAQRCSSHRSLCIKGLHIFLNEKLVLYSYVEKLEISGSKNSFWKSRSSVHLEYGNTCERFCNF